MHGGKIYLPQPMVSYIKKWVSYRTQKTFKHHCLIVHVLCMGGNLPLLLIPYMWVVMVHA